MSSEERQQVLRMVEQGRINADEAMKLMKALDQSSAEVEIIEAAPAPASPDGLPRAPEFDEVARRARRLWQIPLWVGVLITVLSAYWMYTLVGRADYGFWFYFAWLPLVLGMLMIALFAGSQTSRWLYVNVVQAEGAEWPHHITFGFPIPLGLASWFLRNFGNNIEGLRQANVDEIVAILAHGISAQEPLIVHVDEGAHGERVQIYIG